MAKKIKVGIVGCGNIGTNLARFIATELKKKMSLSAVYDIDEEKARRLISALAAPARFLDLEKLIDRVDLVIETAQIDAARILIEKVVKKKKDIMVLSLGAFIRYPHLVGLIGSHQGHVYIPSGAICGLDGIRSVRSAGIKKVTLTTSKPPRSLANVDYLEKKKIDVFRIKNEKVVFKGSVKDAIECFPKNINVAAALYLASHHKGLEVVVKVDPRLTRNTHTIEVISDAACIRIVVENLPSPDNPRTSYLTILSARSLLAQMVSNVKIGS